MRLSATDAALLKEIPYLPHDHVTDILEEAGLLARTEPACATTAWAHTRIAPLPTAMQAQVEVWLTVMRDGTTRTPRQRPRTKATIRLHLSSALPALAHWAQHGATTLCEITSGDITTVLPAPGLERSRMIGGLRSLFRVLTARRLLPTDPTQQLSPGGDGSTIPLPLKVEPTRQALESADPAQALLCALIAFHGLHRHQLRHLRLTDFDGEGRLTTGDRVIILAAPVRERLAAYLQHRTHCWPATGNPHLFIHVRTAVTTACVGPAWVGQHLGPHLTTRTLRNDRILNEAFATGGDAKHLSEMFGISLPAARRYTSVLGHPDLNSPNLHTPTP
ncbi:hypothetical protein ACFWA4_32200 [Streptomyces sp. NPDC060011]|uniref:hypothetical protein n=1 Tax=Streptomyces sp. NPDC060011 TaxID=3347037 RepID=UPI0036C42104